MLMNVAATKTAPTVTYGLMLAHTVACQGEVRVTPLNQAKIG